MGNVVKEKSFAFAVRIVNLSKHHTTEKQEFVLSKQVLRSGTAIGALVREAEQGEQGESKADFIHQLHSQNGDRSQGSQRNRIRDSSSPRNELAHFAGSRLHPERHERIAETSDKNHQISKERNGTGIGLRLLVMEVIADQFNPGFNGICKSFAENETQRSSDNGP